MNVWLYDIESFAHDWCIVARQVGSESVKTFANDGESVRLWLAREKPVLGGYNNKHYDDWILTSIIGGATAEEVNEHSRYIVNDGGVPWEFRTVAHRRRPFQSFDLRDDTVDEGLSLKAVAGNLGLKIQESSIPFDIPTKLTADQMDETIRYCINDVAITRALYDERKDYLENKMGVGRLYGLGEVRALGMTNARLCSAVLGARAREYGDERDIVLPDCIDRELVPASVWDFFDRIHDRSIPDEELFASSLTVSLRGCPVTYAWGGFHGASVKSCDDGKRRSGVEYHASDELAIENWDVASLYPSSMLNFGYLSRTMGADGANRYREIYGDRLKAKHAGDKPKANALKLIVNTTYGASLAKTNPLYDPRMGRSVCVANQLAMTNLAMRLLGACPSLKFVNINTDGIMYTVHPSESPKAAEVVEAWCSLTGFEMELDKYSDVWQKDVNNYVGVMTNGKVKHKGGYVSIADGGNFRTNSLQVVHRAVVDYFTRGIDPADTIRACDDLGAFQNIVKCAGKGAWVEHERHGVRHVEQKVNRVFAVKDENYGTLYRMTRRKVRPKWAGKRREDYKTQSGWTNYLKRQASERAALTDEQRAELDATGVYTAPASAKIGAAPEHCRIDNMLTMCRSDIDESWYIRQAYNRVNDYRTGALVDIEGMECYDMTNKTTTPETPETPKVLNVYGKLNLARARFLAASPKKTGINRFAGYKYFELADIVPTATTIFNEVGVFVEMGIAVDNAWAIVRDVDNPDDIITFSVPNAQLETVSQNGKEKMNAIQAVGCSITYLRRYLYQLVLDIVEADGFDATQGKPEQGGAATATVAAITNADGPATEAQVKSIKGGLKKLNAKPGCEDYVKSAAIRLSQGITRREADNMMVEIGEKISKEEL